VAHRLDDVSEAEWEQAEVLYTTLLMPPPALAPRLRWIQGHFAGVEHLFEAPEQLGEARLTTSSGIHAPQMAEYVLMMMLAHAHHLPRMLAHQAERHWSPARWKDFVPEELRGATLGVVGYGSIGRECARLAAAFGMRVLAAKRRPDQRADTGWQMSGLGDPTGEVPQRIFGMDELHALLGASDYVLLCVPVTPGTRRLIDAEALRAMKPGGFLINVGRGALVDEAAVAQALRAGTIGGAALDVFAVEPLPTDSPLWDAPNVILSPHVSGFSPHYDERAMALFAANLRRYLDGEPLINEVDRQRQY
jgi:phosphoglycerate dehydrogenase-like enzyme